MAEAARPGPRGLPDRGPARRGRAAIPRRPGAPCLSRGDGLSLPLAPKMAPFTPLRGFGASRPRRRTGAGGAETPGGGGFEIRAGGLGFKRPETEPETVL